LAGVRARPDAGEVSLLNLTGIGSERIGRSACRRPIRLGMHPP